MKLNEIRDNDGARKGRMRVGRGIGSGKGIVAEEAGSKAIMALQPDRFTA